MNRKAGTVGEQQLCAHQVQDMSFAYGFAALVQAHNIVPESSYPSSLLDEETGLQDLAEC